MRASSALFALLLAGAGPALAQYSTGPTFGTPTVMCAAPTASQCMSSTYADTSCGRYWTGRALNGHSVCSGSCPASPTLAQCTSNSFLGTVCGAVEGYRMAASGADAAVEHDTLAQACGRPTAGCRYQICAAMVERQEDDGSVVAGAAFTRVVRPAYSDPELANETADTLSLQQNGYSDLTDTTWKRRVEPSFSGWRAEGGSTHWWGDRLANHAAHLQSFTQGALMPLWITQQKQRKAQERAAWEANENKVDSCREYVYEKYFDYSKFEDAAFQPGVDYRKIYEIAFGHPMARSSIGTNILNGTGLRQRNGNPSPGALTFKKDQPRNPFFSYTMPGATARNAVIDEWRQSGHVYTVTLRSQTFTIELDRPVFTTTSADGEFNLIQKFDFVPMDGPLFGALQDRALHDESIAFHKARSDAMSAQGIPDEVLFVYDRLKDDFLRLVQRRADIEHELHVLGAYGMEAFDDEFLFEDAVFDPTIFENPAAALSSPLDSVLSAQRDRTEVFDISAGAGLAGVRDMGGVRLGMETQIVTYSNTPGVDDGPEPTSQEQRFVLRFFGLLQELVAIDAEMEAALLYADEMGCVDPDHSPFNGESPCDWSPRDFAEAMQDQLTANREQDLARCEEFTTGDFDAYRLREFVANRFSPRVDTSDDGEIKYVYWDGRVCDSWSYNSSPDKLDRYPGCFDAWRVAIMKNIARFYERLEAQLEGAKNLIDPRTGNIRPNEQTGDSDGFGDGTFGASYDYSAGWDMVLPSEASANSPSAACAMRPSAHASFDVEARIFGAEADIVSASLEAGIGTNATNRAFLEIVGVELINEGSGTTNVSASTYNILFEASDSDYDEYFSASATFMVGPVPVTISAGAGGVIAASVTAAGGSLDGGQGCSQGDIGIEAAFTPSYGIMGFASAGVDALIVEVGVKIELTIVQLSFPYRVGLSLDKSISGWKLQLTNDLDIVLSILGGRMAGYVEVCFILCEEFDVTLWRWAPTRLKSNIFHSALDFDMSALLKAQELLPISVPGAQ